MDAKLKIAGLLGAAVLAIPGAGLIGNAVAADTSSSPSTTTVQQEQAPPGDQQRPDREDCPEKEGGSGSADDSAPDTSGTAL